VKDNVALKIKSAFRNSPQNPAGMMVKGSAFGAMMAWVHILISHFKAES
jgi:hypothetical protein